MFAEIFQTSAGNRVFNVSLEGEEVISNLDIFDKVGKDAAYNETFEVIISDGEINIDFSTISDNAKISAIKISSKAFEGKSYSLTTNNPLNGVIEIMPDKASYPAGSNVQLSAIPNPGYMFEGWSGDFTGTENPVTVYMNDNKNISATFTEITSTSDIFANNSAQTILMQNYPNPFSTETNIQYELNEASDVKLTICNLLGHQIATLVNKHQPAGSHSVKWIAKNNNGEHFSSGLYIYRLETGNNCTLVKKASLIK